MTATCNVRFPPIADVSTRCDIGGLEDERVAKLVKREPVGKAE